MCGITGVFARGPVDPRELEEWVTAMADAIRHRGPDDFGTWVDAGPVVALGFRRLSIIDLSPTGHQPMQSASGRFTMVFNGEAYNYQILRDELRQKGHQFRGTSDTEVILAGCEEWGLLPTIQRLVGMFAIAAWDARERSLTLARDRLGKKPLYIARGARGVSFASELRGILAGPPIERRVDPEAAALYLKRLYVPAPRAMLHGTRQLPPGHYWTISSPDAPFDSRAYWSVEDAAREGARRRYGGSLEDATAELEALLRDAVSKRMYADVPVGALLSGGIDSSLVVALMREVTRGPVLTYHVGFESRVHDESSHAAAVAKHLGTRHREIRMDSAALLELMPQAARLFDEPHANPSQVPTFLVSRLAREEVTVALTGDGGDEVFGGYNRYTDGDRVISRVLGLPRAGRLLASSMLAAVPAGVWRGVEGSFRGTRLLAEKTGKLAALLRRDTAFGMYDSLLSTAPEAGALLRQEAPREAGGFPDLDGSSLVDRMMLYDQMQYLSGDLLAKVDRASMATSLEIRNPLLDHRVVEFAWRLPPEARIRDGQGKWILRRLLEPRLPAHLRTRPKVGFSVPIAEWLAGPLRSWAEERIGAGRRADSSVIDQAAVDALWRRFLRGEARFALPLWALLVLIAWGEEYQVQV